MNTASKSTLIEILNKYGLAPLKKFGQNFLCDGNIVEKIADSMNLTKEDYVLEVGPGLGALTLAIARRAKQVVAVEIDKGLISALREILADAPNVTVIEGDILKTDVRQIINDLFNGSSFHACGNLPYYITAPCILKLIESGAKSLTVMVQKEVAERLSAYPGSKNYGSITASVAYYTHPETLFTVSHACFYPAPDVASAIVHMDMSGPPLPVSRSAYVRIVRAAFAMRRKTIYNNLLAEFSGDYADRAKQAVTSAIISCGIKPAARAEDLSSEDFLRLAIWFEQNSVQLNRNTV